MTLSVTNIMTRARERYNAVGDDFFSDQMLRDLIFDAQSILAKEGWVIEKTFTTPSIADTREYSYPVTTLGIKEIRYDNVKIDNVKLRRDPKTNSTDPTGKPIQYSLWNDTIILYPTPSTSDETIQIRVYAYPSDITSNTSAIEVPEEYKEDLINYVLNWMALKDQNTPLADRYEKKWEEAVLRAKKQRKRRLRSDSNTRVTDEYFGSDPINLRLIYG
jgi:hypothetical protein